MDKPLADGKTAQLLVYLEGPFEEEALRWIPEIEGPLQEHRGMFYSQLGVFADAVREGAEEGDFELIQRILSFLDLAISQPRSEEIANAIQVGKFDLDSIEDLPSSDTIKRLIPPRVRELLDHESA